MDDNQIGVKDLLPILRTMAETASHPNHILLRRISELEGSLTKENEKIKVVLLEDHKAVDLPLCTALAEKLANSPNSLIFFLTQWEDLAKDLEKMLVRCAEEANKRVEVNLGTHKALDEAKSEISQLRGECNSMAGALQSSRDTIGKWEDEAHRIKANLTKVQEELDRAKAILAACDANKELILLRGLKADSYDRIATKFGLQIYLDGPKYLMNGSAQTVIEGAVDRMRQKFANAVNALNTP